jgi:hypothetical protein
MEWKSERQAVVVLKKRLLHSWNLLKIKVITLSTIYRKQARADNSD